MGGNVIATAGSATLGFNKKFVVPGGGGAIGIELPHARNAAVGLALAQDTPFPDGPLPLGEFTLSAQAKKPIEFGDADGKVTFGGSANVFAGLGVFRDGASILKSLPFEDSLERSIQFGSPNGDMFLLMQWGYDLKASAKGAMALGFGGKATFGVDARRDGVFAVIRRLPSTTGARTAVADVVHSWVLPRQIDNIDDLQPGTWVIAEVDGAIGLKLGAEFGYDFNWARQTKIGGLKQDVGLRLQLRTNALLGFEAAGKYAVIVSRESLDSAEKRLRMRIFKQSKRGMNFAFNAAASAQGQLPNAPATVDDFVMAVFDLHPTQLIDDLHAIENWLGSDQPLPEKLAELGVDYGLDLLQKVTGVDPKRAFDDARAKLLGLFAEWDKLPERVSSTVWKLVEEKAAGKADLAELRQMLDAINRDAPETFRKIVEKQIASVDFFQKPIGRWLEAAAINGILSVVSDADAFRRLQGVAETTAKLLDPAHHARTLENLQTQLEKRLGLEAIRKGITAAEFDNVDAWLKAKLSEFLGQRINFAALQQIREAVVDILAKRNDFYQQALKALTHKYSFTFTSTYEQSTTRSALLDAEFDLADATAGVLLDEALDGNFNRILVERHPAVRLRAASLTHAIKRTEHVELNLPRSTKITDTLNTALASVTAVEDDGRLLAYDLAASDLVTEKNRRNSRLAVRATIPVRPGTGVRVRSAESIGYSYGFRQAVRHMRSSDLRAQVLPYLQTYFASSFGADSSPSTWIADLDKQIDQLEFNGTENFGNTLVSLELATPASVAGAWLDAPADKKSPAYKEMSERIQGKLKEIIPFYAFADLEAFETVGSAAPLLVYASIPPVRDEWDIEHAPTRKAMIKHPVADLRLTQALQRCHDRLTAAGRNSLAGFYKPTELSILRSTATNDANAGKLESLLRMEAGIISAARSAGLQMAAFRARQWDDPEGAVDALARFGAEMTRAFNSRVGGIYGGAALRPLGTMVFIEAARAFLPPGTPAPTTSALFELTVVRENAPFNLATFLEGQHPPADQVVVQERLARL